MEITVITEDKHDLYRQGQDYAEAFLNKNPESIAIPELLRISSLSDRPFNLGIIDYINYYRKPKRVIK